MSVVCPLPRVLIAEDDAAIRRLLGMTLRRRRMEVHLAADGREALDALRNERYDVLVMDLMMPRLNGWELIRWLGNHSDCRPKSVIVMSASERDALRDLDPSVVNAIFFKPFDVLQLGAYVRSAAGYADSDRRQARRVRTV